MVYSFLVLLTVITLATGVYCETSNSIHFAHIWIQILELITVIMAVVTLLRFYKRVKSERVIRRPLGKLISFKAIVFVGTIQNVSQKERERESRTPHWADMIIQFVFSILRSKVTGSSKITYNDATIGIPACLVCIEQIFFAAAFYYTFSSKEYSNEHEDGSSTRYPLGRAIGDALNPSDLLRGIASAFGLGGRK